MLRANFYPAVVSPHAPKEDEFAYTVRTDDRRLEVRFSEVGLVEVDAVMVLD